MDALRASDAIRGEALFLFAAAGGPVPEADAALAAERVRALAGRMERAAERLLALADRIAPRPDAEWAEAVLAAAREEAGPVVVDLDAFRAGADRADGGVASRGGWA